MEYAEVFGNYYGTARRFLREAMARGQDLLLDIDVQGAAQVKQKVPDAVSIFILPPSREELERRLRRRSEADDELQRKLLGDGAPPFNTEEIIQRRLQTASREIENFSQYDYILVNDRLEQSIDTLKSIVEAERLRRSGADRTSKDDAVLANADVPCAPSMMQQVQIHSGHVRGFPILPPLRSELMKLVEGFDSNYRYVLVAARRARQIQNGAQPVVNTHSRKPCRIAEEEIQAGKVKWEVPQLAEDSDGGRQRDAGGRRPGRRRLGGARQAYRFRSFEQEVGYSPEAHEPGGNKLRGTKKA